MFLFMYIMSKSNAISLIAHLKILENVTLGNTFLELNINSNGLWSDFSQNLFVSKRIPIPFCFCFFGVDIFAIFLVMLSLGDIPSFDIWYP